MGGLGLFWGSAMPPLQGGGAQRSTILGFLSIYAYTLCRRTTKFDAVTRGGGTCILGSATPPIPRQRNSSAPQFWSFLLFMPTPFIAEIPIFNTYEEGFFYGSSAPHPKRGAPALPNFRGSHIFMRTCFVTELPNLTS